MFFQDEIISLSEAPLISLKSNPKSHMLRAVVITSNAAKFAEFVQQLDYGYGMSVTQKSVATDDLNQISQSIMAESEYSPHFILREETRLISQDKDEDLTNLTLNELAERSLENVIHTSTLIVYKPTWNEVDGVKMLSGFTKRKYEKRAYGYINPNPKFEGEFGFGWDELFMQSAVNLTNVELIKKYGKQSARQQTISDFIITYLRYKTMVSLKHHQLPLKNCPIEFGENYLSIPSFIASEPHLSNEFIREWGVENLRNAVVNEGLFFKGAYSRPVRNYFSPPFSGLPLTAKKDAAEETIFMTHDMLHHLIPDLICDLSTSREGFFIYSAWRMISEACTLVLADMLYADGLIKNGVDRGFVDQRIYPLFEAVKEVQALQNPEHLEKEIKFIAIKKLLFANMRYALLGDDEAWRVLLTDEEGRISEISLARLDAYKNHFGKFFIGDHAWTKANYENMHRYPEILQNWIKAIGKETFAKAKIPLLSDVLRQLKIRCDKDSYSNVADAVFNHIFTQKIEPLLCEEEVKFEDEALIQSRAFRRFLIGQASIFSRYPTPPNCGHLLNEVYARLQQDEPFTIQEQLIYRNKLKQFINGVMGMRLMTLAEGKNATDCVSVFPPVYISYPAMQLAYGSIENCVQNCVVAYGETLVSSQARLAPNLSLFQPPKSFMKDFSKAEILTQNAYVRLINGVNFIDTEALERAVSSKEIKIADKLRQKMRLAGVEFWDEEQTIIKKPVIGISSVGGFLICLEGNLPAGTVQLRFGQSISEPIEIKNLADGIRCTMGAQSIPTYMNPQGKSTQALYEATVKHGHFSIAHGASLGVSCLGISKKAELELDVQRDLVHLARETSARSACQDSPCLVAMTENGARRAKEVLVSTLKALEQFKKPQENLLDWREERNALYPLSSAQFLGINGSCRNLQKLVHDLKGDGKELEYRNILALLNDSLHAFLPELFVSTKSLGHTYPEEWLTKVKASKTAILLLGAPGVGKSTQTTLLTQNDPGVFCISTGNLVRKLLKKVETQQPLTAVEERAALSLERMKRGELMDDAPVYALLMEYISVGGEGYLDYQQAHTIILDGVIKQVSNIRPFIDAVNVFNEHCTNVFLKLEKVIYLYADMQALQSRHEQRVATTESTQQRPDDSKQVYINRLKAFDMHIQTLIWHYQSDETVKFFEIDTSYGIERTQTEILNVLKSNHLNEELNFFPG